MPQVPSLSKNRRGAVRRRPKRASKVFCYKGTFGLGRNLALELLDISESGIRLRIKEGLPEGQVVEIQLLGLAQRVPVKMVGTVMWSVAAADGSHCIGARFDKSLRYGDLQLLA
jgi:hypothetical protein